MPTLRVSAALRACLRSECRVVARPGAHRAAPRLNLVRYHGTLAPNAKLRSAIVPKAKAAKTDEPACAVEKEDQTPESAAKGYRWAEFMRRVFEKDVLQCPRCDGRLKLIATIVKGKVIRKILESIGLPARPPASVRSRSWSLAAGPGPREPLSLADPQRT
jgi:hypothetical protein